jgi:hypothetical protein
MYSTCCYVTYFLNLLFDAVDEYSILHLNVDSLLPDYTTLHAWRQYASYSLPREPKIS